MPVTILSDGTGLVTIHPIDAFNPSTFVVNGFTLPFVSVASGSSTTPFVTAPTSAFTPFNSQYVNAVTYAVDSVQVDFIET